MKRLFAIASILGVMVLFTSCRAANDEISANTIKIAGSTSVAPLMKTLKTGYEEEYQYAVEIQESGSSSGILSTIEGASQIAMSSRELSDKELANGLTEIPIALDGIVMVTGLENPVEGLTLAEIKGIFSGEITNWSMVGGDDLDIIVISREEGSGTRTAFEELTGLEVDGLISSSALFENSTGAVKSNVMLAKNALGYISLGTFDNRVKALQVNGYTCNEQNIKVGNYPLARPYYLCITKNCGERAQELIDFVLSDSGQKIVVDSGYIGIN